MVCRLDLEFFDIRNRYQPHTRDQVALIMARSFEGEKSIFEAALGTVDLFQFHRQLLATSQAKLDAIEDELITPNIAVEVLYIESLLVDELGPRKGPSPAITFLIGDPDGTNARSFGPDPISGRPRVLINVAAHADRTAITLSLAHELVHTRQTSFGQTLGEKAVTEGVAAYVTGMLFVGRTEAELLMWSEETLRQAKGHKEAIFEMFLAQTRQKGPVIDQWLFLGSNLKAVPGAPDRCAYWVGYLAAEAWVQANPDTGVEGLVSASPSEVLASIGLK